MSLSHDVDDNTHEDEPFLADSKIVLKKPLNTIRSRILARELQPSYVSFLVLQVFFISLYTTVFFAIRKHHTIYCKAPLSPTMNLSH